MLRHEAFWRRLFYRWFVEYNPLYLVSAALVLVGCFLVSRDLVGGEALAASLGIAAVSEIYALSLIAGAALLLRIGLRRPAVMLALLSLLYQWDLTLHTETCAYLGVAGAWASAAWVTLFAGKIFALGRALRVRFARHVVAAAILAGVGLAIGPRVLPMLGARGGEAAIATFLFALGSLYRGGGISSETPLTAWGHVVLARTMRAAWILSGGLVAFHAWYWCRDHAIAMSSVIVIAPLLAVRWVRSEAKTWSLILATLAFVAAFLPGAFSATALLSAAALLVRACSPAFAADPGASAPVETPSQPYRTSTAVATTEPPRPPLRAARVGHDELARAVAGAIGAGYLSVWTLRWSGGPFPAHVLVLDVAFAVVVLLAARRWRTPLALAAVAADGLHLLFQSGLVPMPRTHLGWGVATVTLGFALLAGSLAASYRFATRRPTEPDRG